jgi:G:T-mismatch repair DNA endonuclease (very short patch repair protein)
VTRETIEASEAQKARDEDLGEELRRAEAEIERLREAKHRALVIAEERAKENCELRAEIERLWAALEGR